MVRRLSTWSVGILAGLLGIPVLGAGPGTLYFNNRLRAAGIDAPVFDTDCQTPLNSRFEAQLYVGLSPDSLAPVGKPLEFRDGPGVGYVQAGEVVLTPFPAGTRVYVELRAWESQPDVPGIPPPAKFGRSAVFPVVLGGDTGNGPPVPPADLVGLQSFCLQEVNQPPFVRINPQAVETFPGWPLTFVAETWGTPPFTYQWRRNGVDLPGANAQRLTLPAVGTEHLGEYTVVVANRVGTVISEPAALRFVPAPAGPAVLFANRAPGVDARVFDTDCQTPLVGSNFVAEIWTGPSPENLQPTGETRPFDWSPQTGEQSGYFAPAWLEIAGVAAGQTTWAQVRVWDASAAGTFAEAVALGFKHGASPVFTVQTRLAGATSAHPPPLVGLQSFCLQQVPVIQRSPESVSLHPGDPLRLEVEVSSAQPVTYQWFRNGEVIPGATGPRLELARVTSSDAGAYTVTVSNPVGSVTTPPAWLRVLTLSGGGTVQFANHGPDGWAVPVFEADGVTPLSGSRYRAELLAGPTPESLQAPGIEAPFLDLPLAGFFGGTIQALTNIPPDTVTWGVVRAWDTWFGATYEEAAAVRRAGQSEPFTFVTGGHDGPAGRLEAMKSFRLEASAPPLILVQPPEFSWVIEGTPITFPVVATNYVHVFWERRTPKGWVVVPGAESAWLSFSSATLADGGEYRAVLVSQGNPVYTTTATLEVGRVLRAGNGTSGGFSLRVEPEVGPVFDLEGSTNLVNWTVLTRLTNTSGVVELSETPSARQWGARFYRARSVATGRAASEIVGFVEVELPPGFSLVGISLIPPSPRVADLLAGLPVDTVLYKYHPDGRGFTINTLWEDGWTSPDDTFTLGEACLLGNPTSDVYRLTLHGTVPTGEQVRMLPAGWSLQALPLPRVGRLDRELSCPLRPQEMIARWEARPAGLRFAVFTRDQWLDGGTFQPTQAPELAPGEGFWIYKHAPEAWRVVFDPEP